MGGDVRRDQDLGPPAGLRDRVADSLVVLVGLERPDDADALPVPTAGIEQAVGLGSAASVELQRLSVAVDVGATDEGLHPAAGRVLDEDEASVGRWRFANRH